VHAGADYPAGRAAGLGGGFDVDPALPEGEDLNIGDSVVGKVENGGGTIGAQNIHHSRATSPSAFKPRNLFHHQPRRAHLFDEAQFKVSPQCPCQEPRGSVVIDTPHQHGVDLDGAQANGVCGFDAGENLAEERAPGQLRKSFLMQGVEGDINPWLNPPL
jgi:hypothetical protein